MGLAVNPITAVELLLLLSILAAPPPVSAKLKTTTIPFASFTSNDPLHVDQPATINNGALQVTLDTANAAFSSLTNQSRRILYDTFSDRVASFNASFLLNIYRLTDSPTPVLAEISREPLLSMGG